MFRGIFGTKSDRPSPPKNQIEVVCPACGAAQFEPRLVVSTLCKKCGTHLNIDRKKVTASSMRPGAVGSKESGTKSKAPPRSAASEKPAPEPASPPPAPKAAAASTPPPESHPPAESNVGFGAFLKQQIGVSAAVAPAPKAAVPPLKQGPAKGSIREPVPDLIQAVDPVSIAPPVQPAASPPAASPPAASSPAPPTSAPEVPAARTAPEVIMEAERRPHSHSPAPTPAPVPMSASTLQKMKDQGMYRNQYFKDAECFECGHKFKVSRSSRSANCPQCGAAIAMEDIEINMASTQAIKTRGDVLIRKRGSLTTHSVQCKDLRCYGQLDANIKASGDAVFRTSGPIAGEVHCHRFVIEKDSDVSFLNPVHADEVEVHARVTGTIIANGPVFIGSNGSVNGDVTARSVSIDSGGELNGAMNILRSKPAVAKQPAEIKPEAPA